MISRHTKDAQLVWRQLNGIISVFKPAGVKTTQVKYSVISNLVRDLNQMKTREPRQFLSIDGHNLNSGNRSSLIVAKTTNPTANANTEINLPAFRVNINTDLSDHVLAVGQRYQIEDVRCNVVSTLGVNTSGVLLLGLNGGTRDAFHIAKSKLLRSYHVHGRLGTGTEDNFPHTRQTVRSSFNHVYADKLNGLLASMQSSHQKKMFEVCGVDMQSQAAYELAAGGLIRPADDRMPVVYGLKCVHFARPDFTLEVHTMNESEDYFGQLVQEIGIQLHTVAHCTGVRCIRHGHFGVEDSLLRRLWTVQGVVDSVERNRRLLERYPEILRQRHARLEKATGEGDESNERAINVN